MAQHGMRCFYGDNEILDSRLRGNDAKVAVSVKDIYLESRRGGNDSKIAELVQRIYLDSRLRGNDGIFVHASASI
jgi:hypothetical protein